MEYVILNNGVKMPILGFGVWQIPDADECETLRPPAHGPDPASASRPLSLQAVYTSDVKATELTHETCCLLG
jgi:diketogulonate reductase-like aldo/keto reductase